MARDEVGTLARLKACRAIVDELIASHRGRIFNAAGDSVVAGFRNRGGQLICTYFDENLLGLLPAPHVEGLYGCLDYYQNVSDPYSKTLLGAYNNRYPDEEQFTGGSACSGLYRGMKLWAAAVNEAGSLRQEDVIAALDHARIAEGPGGPAEMVPGQHHVRMNMYIAQAKNGRFEIVESLGTIDPDEAMVPAAAEVGRGPIS